jgi:hypothetical protein
MSMEDERTAPAPSRRRRDALTFLSLVAVAFLLIGGLWTAARSAPSAAQRTRVALPTPALAGDDGCAQFARYWMVDSGLNVPAKAVAQIGNCRQASDGTWFLPLGAGDKRLRPESRLTESERARAKELRALLRADPLALREEMPPSLWRGLRRNYDPRNRPVMGHTKWGAEQRYFRIMRNRYLRLTQAFLMSPERVLLADYVGWRMSQRLDAASAFEAACLEKPELRLLEQACLGLREDLSVERIPIYWDLTDPLFIEEYLVEVVRRGRELPDGVPFPSQQPS